jgi:hypothetical protein
MQLSHFATGLVPGVIGYTATGRVERHGTLRGRAGGGAEIPLQAHAVLALQAGTGRP